MNVIPVLIVGGLFGIVLGFGIADYNNRPKSIIAALLVAAFFGCVVLVGMVPGAVALTFGASIATTAVSAICLPRDNFIARFFQRALK